MARTDEKIRQPFACYDHVGKLYANGIIYEQGNVVVKYRKELGPTEEQFSNFGVFQSLFHKEITTIQFNQGIPPACIVVNLQPTALLRKNDPKDIADSKDVLVDYSTISLGEKP